jgi:hypothetical protein
MLAHPRYSAAKFSGGYEREYRRNNALASGPLIFHYWTRNAIHPAVDLETSRSGFPYRNLWEFLAGRSFTPARGFFQREK